MKKLVSITVLTLLLFASSSIVAAQVPYAGNGHLYAIVEDAFINWDDAYAAAEALELGGPLCPGYLATVTSSGEDDFIINTFTIGVLNTKWLGGIQPDACDLDEGWEWITGETWDYTNWGPGEPNNIFGQGGIQSCEDALQYRLLEGIPGWNDAPREWTYYGGGGYVVEFSCYQVMIDIKPGSDPNCFNINGHGVIPVAILGSADLDVTEVVPESLSFGGIEVRVRGNKGPLCSIEEVSGDAYLDLVCQFEDDPDMWQPDNGSAATLTGTLSDGTSITGVDSICIVP